jgi:glycosyltransferase involved in cell wall biosynthesis
VRLDALLFRCDYRPVWHRNHQSRRPANWSLKSRGIPPDNPSADDNYVAAIEPAPGSIRVEPTDFGSGTFSRRLNQPLATGIPQNERFMLMKKISVISGCYNEEGNLQEFYDRLIAVFKQLPGYTYEIIISDNCSSDRSREILRGIAAKDPQFKVILNANNFGHIRSPFNALLQATGDAVVALCSDLQEPPEMIGEFVKQWEAGYQVVCAVKPTSLENPLLFQIRRGYYMLLASCSDTPQIQNFTGFGLYDRKVINAVKKFNDPYPYFRGLISEIGFKRIEVPFQQAARRHGKTKNNLFTLYDLAMTGFVNHTKLPLRLAAFFGFLLAFLSLLVAIGYFIYKLLFWQTFSLGLAPMVIGLFFFSSVQLIFIGLLGEYIGAIWTQVKNKPLVIEEERINFDK